MFENINFMEKTFFLTSKLNICQILQFFLMIIFRFSVKTLKKICFCLFESLKSVKILSLRFKENQMLHHIAYRKKKNRIDKFCFEKLLATSGVFAQEKMLNFCCKKSFRRTSNARKCYTCLKMLSVFFSWQKKKLGFWRGPESRS